MKKERWKRCIKCGIITDWDDKKCPKRGLDNPRHKLRIVKLDDKEIKKLCKKGKVWTKHVSDFEKRFK